MRNDERGTMNRRSREVCSSFIVHRSSFIFLVLVSCAVSSFANELSVDKRSMQLDDTLTITVTLDGPYTRIDSLRVPLRNLVIDGNPSVSSEFQWINGQTSRRKIFRYSA